MSESFTVTPPSAEIQRLVGENPTSGWNEAWSRNITPWDAGYAQPPLKDLLESNELPLPRSGKALVPGCGRGVDAILVAEKLGLHTIGLDISPIAVETAEKTLHATPNGPVDKCSFKADDFFSLPSSTEADKFDLIYDHTFFVAINPSRRSKWGRQMGALCKSGGYLITLIFPIIDPPQQGGPPYAVRPEHYVEVLDTHQWEKVIDRIPENGSESHVGRQKLVVWKRL